MAYEDRAPKRPVSTTGAISREPRPSCQIVRVECNRFQPPYASS
jgi:hypothetical protein